MANIDAYIHVSGPPGAGKTTLGERIRDKFSVKDIDDFFNEIGVSHLSSGSASTTKKYINTIVKNMNNWIDLSKINDPRPIILVGLSYIYNAESEEGIHLLPIHAQWNYNLDISSDILFTRILARGKSLQEDDKKVLKENIEKIKKESDNIYANLGYEFSDWDKTWFEIDGLIHLFSKLSFDYYPDIWKFSY